MVFDIVIATGNAGKAAEIAGIIEEAGVLTGRAHVRTLKDVIGSLPDVDENGDTLRENARLKAYAARKALDAFREVKPESSAASIVVADDSGLFVDALGGRPGVYSARYGSPAVGSGTTDSNKPDSIPSSREQVLLLLDEMRGVPAEERKACFRCVMAIGYPDGNWSFTEGVCEGEIGFEPKGNNGFGYDPIFFLPSRGKTMAELSGAEKNAVSHRGIAVGHMAAAILSYIRKIT